MLASAKGDDVLEAGLDVGGELKKGDKFHFHFQLIPNTISLPLFYLFFACSISMRSVACGALPCMCLK